MNGANTLLEAEKAISSLSENDKIRLLRWLELQVNGGVERNENVMGGAACIRKTRIPVWLLEQARRQGVSESAILQNYPQLTAQDLFSAWEYVNSHPAEIDAAIAANESDD